MIIKTETTSDNNILNFFLPKSLTNGKCLEATTYKSVRKSPFAEQLFDIEGIKSILIGPDMVSITKQDDANWEDIKPFALAEITDAISSGIFSCELQRDEADILNQISGLIEARIRPAIQRDGGDIKFIKFEKNIVYVKLLGKCVGCAYAEVTLKQGVEKTLKNYIPEINEVVAIEE